MIGGEEEAPFGEAREQPRQIVTATLDLDVITLANIQNANMNIRAAGHTAGDFLAQEEIGMLAEGFGAFDRIVIGKSDEVHTGLLEALVNAVRSTVRLTTNETEAGVSAHPGEPGMDVKVALHAYKGEAAMLLREECEDKVCSQFTI
jgi:hypothetical protein